MCTYIWILVTNISNSVLKLDFMDFINNWIYLGFLLFFFQKYLVLLVFFINLLQMELFSMELCKMVFM